MLRSPISPYHEEPWPELFLAHPCTTASPISFSGYQRAFHPRLAGDNLRTGWISLHNLPNLKNAPDPDVVIDG